MPKLSTPIKAMDRLHRLPISKKMNIAIFSTTLLALLMSWGAIMTYELTTFRRSAMKDLVALSKIVAANSTGALAFQDANAADRILQELRDQKVIIAARIYSKDGKPFATFVAPNSGKTHVPEKAQPDGTDAGFTRLHIVLPIQHKEGDRIGSLYMESQLDHLYKRLFRYSLLVGAVIVLLLPVIFFVSKAFQHFIATPIKDLADVAKMVADRKNYSIRANNSPPDFGQDEVGLLTNTFNEMLETIENREESLIQHAEELSRSNRELEQFAYISSHDLQEPLRKVTTYAQLLQEQYKDQQDPDTAKFVHNITDSASRMRRLIQDVLAYSQLGRVEPLSEQVPLEMTVKQVLSDMEVLIKEKKATVTFDALPTIDANPSQMYQLFKNLITNALKFNQNPSGTVHISATQGNKEWMIAVKDNGIGIAPQYQDQIFKVFQRLHKQNEYPGTGIGLAVCKKIVERLGGQIWVESETGHGATFFFSIPLSKTVNKETKHD